MCGDSAGTTRTGSECAGLRGHWGISRLGPGQTLTQQQLCLLVQHLLGSMTSLPSSLHLSHGAAFGEQCSTVLEGQRDKSSEEMALQPDLPRAGSVGVSEALSVSSAPGELLRIPIPPAPSWAGPTPEVPCSLWSTGKRPMAKALAVALHSQMMSLGDGEVP